MNIPRLACEIGLDEAQYVELLELFAQTTESDLASIKTAVASGDAQRALCASHSIKGSAANLGLMDISDEARRIEEQSRDGRLGDVDANVRALEGHFAEIVRSLKR